MPLQKKVLKHSQGKEKKKNESKTNRRRASTYDDIFLEPVQRFVKPDHQLDLSEKELMEEITCVLTGDDPNIANGISKFNFKELCYKPDPPGLSDHVSVHFVMNSNLIHKNSSEFRALHKDVLVETIEETTISTTKENDKVIDEESLAENSIFEMSTDLVSKVNKFNYSERCTQTINYPLRHRCVSTEPPPVSQFNADVSKWKIFDAYLKEYRRSQKDKDDPDINKQRTIKDQADQDKIENIDSIKLKKALSKIECLLNQNAQDEIYQDFKYWEDASDQYRKKEGSLLPLWRFLSDRPKRKPVTSLCWNPKQTDLFAAGFGSNDFTRQGSGHICCFSIKNTSHAEYSFVTESGVMCLDFHKEFPSLLAAGCYDGTVMVFNLLDERRIQLKQPIYQSSIITGKHNDPVFDVHWEKSELGKDLSFFSVSSDGTVACWTISKNDLNRDIITEIKLLPNDCTTKDLDDCEEIIGLACACRFDFNPKNENIFLVGTEEGNVYKCSKAFSGEYLSTYRGQQMTITSVKWNPFHEGVFLTCSEDWTVKIWDHNFPHPILSFDLGSVVSDACWAHYSSTVFAAVMHDGRVAIYDLSENQYAPLCHQKIVKKVKLTQVRFHFSEYILIVGDDRGGINSLKLSPNLRKVQPGTEKKAILEFDNDFAQKQKANLEQILGSVD